MSNVRDTEVKLTGVEDRLLARLGYRLYDVYVGNQLVDPPPAVTEKPLSSYTGTQLQGFVDALGGNGNPITTFKLEISRLVPESILREFNYWRLERDDYVATCLPIELIVMDSRIKVLLGVVKIEGTNESQPDPTPD